MSGLVLVDSSVWIEVIRGGGVSNESLRSKVEGLLAERLAALTYPVWLELYQGVKGKKEEQDLTSLRELCGWLEFDDACWNLAAAEGRLCMRSGLNVPQSDLLVHASSRRHRVPLLHCDRHFEMIDRICPA